MVKLSSVILRIQRRKLEGRLKANTCLVPAGPGKNKEKEDMAEYIELIERML
jgi:hypothetical protein